MQNICSVIHIYIIHGRSRSTLVEKGAINMQVQKSMQTHIIYKIKNPLIKFKYSLLHFKFISRSDVALNILNRRISSSKYCLQKKYYLLQLLVVNIADHNLQWKHCIPKPDKQF